MQRKKTKRHCLTWAERLQIEALVKAKRTPEEIAAQLGFHVCTIYRELKRGKTIKRNSDWTEGEIYSPDLAQRKYEEGLKTKGRGLKVGNDHKFVAYIESKIIDEKCSPAAALACIKREGKEFGTEISLSTLYNYIRGGEVFLNLTLGECPGRREVKKKKKKKVQKRLCKGESIEKRLEEVDSRETFGHWEMDTVIGKSTDRKSLLVLTERKTREEIIELLPAHTAAEVVKALNRIERRYTEAGFRKIFRSITVDNGSEFADLEGMERSRRNKKKKRTKVYYCHPYSSYERGSNENQNKLIRRFFQEIVDIFEKRCGWNPKIIRAILDKKLVRMKKYLKKKPFGDIYIVRIGMEEGIAYQKEGWKKFKEGKPLSPEVVKEIKEIIEELQKQIDKEKELSRR